MTTVTVTTTETSTQLSPSWKWTAKPSLKDYQAALDSLCAIKAKHAGWNDHLSKRLHRWCAKVIAAPIVDQAAAFAQGDRFLKQLSTKILVNPFNHNYPLLSPVLDRVWTWEEWCLADFQSRTKSTNSPYDGKPIEAKPHLYARAVIAWLRTMRTHEPIKSPLDSLIPRLPESSDAAKAYFSIYALLSKRDLTQQAAREMRFETEEADKEYDAKAAESEKRTKEESKKNVEKLEQLSSIFKKGLAANRQLHKEDTDRLKEQQRLLREKLEKVAKDKEKMSEQITKQEQEIRWLFYENERRRKEIAFLKEQAEDDNGCPIM